MVLLNYKNCVKYKMLISKINFVSGFKLVGCIRKVRYLISLDFSKIIFISLKYLWLRKEIVGYLWDFDIMEYMYFG